MIRGLLLIYCLFPFSGFSGIRSVIFSYQSIACFPLFSYCPAMFTIFSSFFPHLFKCVFPFPSSLVALFAKVTGSHRCEHRLTPTTCQVQDMIQWCVLTCTCIHCLYLYLHIHADVHIHTYLHTYLPTYLHTYIPTYIPTYLHTYIPTYLHTYIPTYIPAYIHAYIHSYIHACMHAYIHTDLHTCIGTCIGTCILACLHTCILAYLTCVHT